MKKVLFFFILFFFSFSLVVAKEYYPEDLEIGNIISSKDTLIATLYFGTSMPDSIHIVYYDINDNLIEAFTISNGFDFTYYTYDLLQPYDRSMYIWRGVEYSFGDTCFSTYSNYSNEHVEWCDKFLNMYSLNDNSLKEGYWKVVSVYEKKLSDFCGETTAVKQSFSCNDGMIFRYDEYELIILKEYLPVTFELVCEPKEVKKGETSNCELKVNAFEEISELTIPMNSDLFDITKYNEVEGWELVDNEDGTVTIKSEDGFKGECVILGATIKFKEDLTDDVEIALNDIHYVTADGIELNGSAKDNITIYEEPVVENPKVEDTKEEVDNPNTFDNVSLVSVLSLVTIFIALMIYRMKRIFR